MLQTTDRPGQRPATVREGFYHGTRVLFVPLTKGHEAIVEPADWHRIARQYGSRWCAAVANGYVYARKAVTFPDGTLSMASMSRLIMDARPDERVLTDNGNPLDLRRSNLHRKRFRGATADRRRERHHVRQEPTEAATTP
ncbi:hypothetical protein [Salinisphaera orenii]|uniref:Uncharacterized protein n=1 Tax=Salinisphaera orenii YIM 95161 TaxID=1051139 RepID=A0A423PMG1_9GAMM|nr:hypothetical protein [Salinisphaera halophila]ROO26779.1 hypothetical protein SAHL_12455 [Salinisphaera halophila YIM 95161]